MRDFLNAILAFIGAASLSDVEFEALTIETSGYDQQTYGALEAVLVSRESVSTTKDRLRSFFFAKGVLVSDTTNAKSNILLGSVL